MERTRINKNRKKAVISFIIFIICLTKYVLVNLYEVIPRYGSTSRDITWFIILPAVIIGLILSISVISENFKSNRKNLINILLVLPMLFFIFYFFVIKLF